MSSTAAPHVPAQPSAATDPAVRTEPGRRPWWLRYRGQWTMVLLVPFVVWAAVVPPPFAVGTAPELACRLLGWSLFLTGALFRFWATLHIGGRKAKQLIDSGPYSLCRNPLYFGTALLSVSLAVFLQSPALTIGLLTAGLLYLGTTIAAEEANLRVKLGPDYVAYCRRVPRFFPSPRNFVYPAFLEVNMAGMAIECRRALRWAWIPLVAEVANLARVGAFPLWPR